jgi:hypothetical protein
MTDPLVKNPVPPVTPPPRPYGGLPPRPWWGHPPTSEMLYHHLGNEGFRIVEYIYEHLGDMEYLIYLLESFQASEQEEQEPVEVEVDLPHKYTFKTSHYIVFKGDEIPGNSELSDYQKIKLSKDSLLEYEYQAFSYNYVQVKVHPKVTVIDHVIYYIFPLEDDLALTSAHPRNIYVRVARNTDLPGISEVNRSLDTIDFGKYLEHKSSRDWDWKEASNCPITGEQEFTYGYIGDMVY